MRIFCIYSRYPGVEEIVSKIEDTVSILSNADEFNQEHVSLLVTAMNQKLEEIHGIRKMAEGTHDLKGATFEACENTKTSQACMEKTRPPKSICIKDLVLIKRLNSLFWPLIITYVSLVPEKKKCN